MSSIGIDCIREEQGSLGPLLANSVEVRPVADWGTAFALPVGENIVFPGPATSSMFEHCAAYIQAAANGTVVTIDADDFRRGADEQVCDAVACWMLEGIESMAFGGEHRRARVAQSGQCECGAVHRGVEFRGSGPGDAVEWRHDDGGVDAGSA